MPSRIKGALTIAVLLVAIGLGIAYAASVEISRDVPGAITINFVSIQESADIDGNGKVDRQDLEAVARKLNSRSDGEVREDINHDGIVDVADLAIVARYFGQPV